jgi:hypothetical protein
MCRSFTSCTCHERYGISFTEISFFTHLDIYSRQSSVSFSNVGFFGSYNVWIKFVSMLRYVDTFSLSSHFNVHLNRIQSPEEGGKIFLQNVGKNLLRYVL